MISAQVSQKVPAIRQRYVTPNRYTLPVQVRVNPKLALAMGSVSFILLIIFILTHIGTYNVALAYSSVQTNVQISSGVKAQTGKAANQTRTTTANTTNASKTLVRIDQTSPSQYSNTAEYNTWWPSTCSAASMTEVIDAYGHNYKLTDILKIESGIGAITPNDGLLYPEGIDSTAAQFGFTTQTLKNPTLDQMLSFANSGKPVIINFPPPAVGGHWEGGHFLIALGSTTLNGIEYVHLADSSRLDMEYMAVGSPTQAKTFLYYWQGFAKILSPKTTSTTAATNTAYSVIGKPTLTANFINNVLASYNSPAAGKGQALYNLGVKYGIDPAFALAFFMHESGFGTAGEATKTLSLGNLRCIPNFACVDQDRGGYAAFSSWEAGFQAWYTLIKTGYVEGNVSSKCPCTTIGQIIPVYAPANDNNDVQAYINSLTHAITIWHTGKTTV